MSKQTAVKWLVEQIKSDQNQKALSPSEWMQVIEQAKAMEKEQIEEAWDLSRRDIDYQADGNQYYKQTYGKEEQK